VIKKFNKWPGILMILPSPSSSWCRNDYGQFDRVGADGGRGGGADVRLDGDDRVESGALISIAAILA